MTTAAGLPDPQGTPEETARFVIGTAVWAPSVHNTQPWRFAVRRGEISLYADPDRRLAVADPVGREMLISCGAALFNIRLALRYLGWVPDTMVMPDPGRPMLVARIGWSRKVPPAAYERDLYQHVAARRTHRGGFDAGDLPAALLAALAHGAARHGATLQLITDGGPKAALSAVVDAAESLLRLDAARSEELARWAAAPGSSQPDGVPATAYQAVPDVTDLAFPGRDYAQGRGWGTAPARSAPLMRPAGTPGLLTTPGDEPADWVSAGQALQRLLLDASSSGIAAALHTQPLELPELRKLVRVQLAGGSYPQMIVRLGRTSQTTSSVRRPVRDVLL
jgi:nitroreductase